MQIRVWILVLVVGCLWNLPAFSAEPEPIDEAPGEMAEPEPIDEAPGEMAETSEAKGFGHRIAFYLPNRIFDVLDLVRARVRIGPGLAVSARATDVVSVFFGSYSSAYVGLAGPRSRPEVPWPFGVDSKTGIQVSAVKRTTNGDHGPRYSRTEFGAGFQLGILGADVGTDPIEIIDLVAGLLFIDLRKDDY